VTFFTGVTRRVSLLEQELLTLPEYTEFIPIGQVVSEKKLEM
jgi:hypothetical protein